MPSMNTEIYFITHGIELSFLIHFRVLHADHLRLKSLGSQTAQGDEPIWCCGFLKMTYSSHMSLRLLQWAGNGRSLLFCVVVATIILFRRRHLLSYDVNVRVRQIRCPSYQSSWLGTFSLVTIRLCLEKMTPCFWWRNLKTKYLWSHWIVHKAGRSSLSDLVNEAR